MTATGPYWRRWLADQGQPAPSVEDIQKWRRKRAALERYLARPDNSEATSCDWGYCDGDGVSWRWSQHHQGWLPVCRVHQEEER